MIWVTYIDGYGAPQRSLIAPATISRIYPVTQGYQGRRAQIIFTDGKSLEVCEPVQELDELIRKAQRSGPEES